MLLSSSQLDRCNRRMSYSSNIRLRTLHLPQRNVTENKILWRRAKLNSTNLLISSIRARLSQRMNRRGFPTQRTSRQSLSRSMQVGSEGLSPVELRISGAHLTEQRLCSASSKKRHLAGSSLISKATPQGHSTATIQNLSSRSLARVRIRERMTMKLTVIIRLSYPRRTAGT